MFRLFTLLISIISTSALFASPIPGVGSSQVPQLLKNIVISEHGFRLGTTNQTFWSLKQDINSNTNDTFQYVGTAQQSNARFTVNVDRFTKPTSFDTYVKKWVKEYPYFGFEILKTQVMKIGGEPCYLVDFAHRKKNKQMRQFVVVKKDFAVVMTCSDDIARFRETSSQCADLVNNFQWTKDARQR